MIKKIFGILYLFFFSYTLAAQGQLDSFPLLQDLASFKLTSVRLQDKPPGEPGKKTLSLYIFLSPECPLCQNYALTIRQLRKKFDGRVEISGIFPGNAYAKEEIIAFENKYQTGIALYLDESKKLTNYLQATVTPQVILLNRDQLLVYSGAIDDWVQAPGRKRRQASQHYLHDAVEQALQSAVVKISRTKAFGCKINDY